MEGGLRFTCVSAAKVAARLFHMPWSAYVGVFSHEAVALQVLVPLRPQGVEEVVQGVEGVEGVEEELQELEEVAQGLEEVVQGVEELVQGLEGPAELRGEEMRRRRGQHTRTGGCRPRSLRWRPQDQEDPPQAAETTETLRAQPRSPLGSPAKSTTSGNLSLGPVPQEAQQSL